MSLKKLIDALDIEKYFTVTGGAIAPFVDSVPDDRLVFFQHEQAAVMAAEGYYRASGKIAAVLVTSGPGVQNTLNGVCGCWYDSVPCLVISGQVNTRESLDSVACSPRQVGFQEMPVVDIFKSCTVFCEKIKHVSDVSDVFSRAMAAITRGRKGPAVIDFPVDVQMSDFKVDITIPENEDESEIFVVPDLSDFKRPVVVVGNGCRDDTKKLREWLKVPFVTTWAAKDLFPDHPLHFGCHGVYGDRVANFAIQNADLLVILGSRFDTRQSGGCLSKCSKFSKRVMVDIDENEITKLTQRGFEIHYPIVSKVCSFINSSIWLMCPQSWLNALRKIHVYENRPGNVYNVLENVKIPDDAIVIPDCGGNLVWAMQAMNPRRMFTNLGNSSMGYSLPAAIGASLACPGVPIVCVIGDGGIQMNIQELYTVKRLNLPITIIVLNNGGYGIIRQFQDTYLGSRHSAVNMTIDVGKIAQAYGIDVEYTDDITIRRDSPVLYDVNIDFDQKIIPKLEFGNSLENMTPHMPELIEHMIVQPDEYIQAKCWRKL